MGVVAKLGHAIMGGEDAESVNLAVVGVLNAYVKCGLGGGVAV